MCARANYNLRKYDNIDDILFYFFKVAEVTIYSNNFVCAFVQNYKFNITALAQFKEIAIFCRYLSEIFITFSLPNATKTCFFQRAMDLF